MFTQFPSLATALPGSIANFYAGDATHNQGGQAMFVQGIDGETAGGIAVQGWIGTFAVAAIDVFWVLAPNNDTTLTATTGSISTTFGIALAKVLATTTAGIQFYVTCSATASGSSRTFAVTAIVGGVTSTMTAVWSNTTDPIRSFWLKAVSAVDGSEVTVRTLAATVPTAGMASQMTWQVLGS